MHFSFIVQFELYSRYIRYLFMITLSSRYVFIGYYDV